MNKHDDESPSRTHPLKRVPPGAVQHLTAGPYSPVIEVDARRLVVLSGQVAVDLDGKVVGDTIEQQAEATLDNCAGSSQARAAGSPTSLRSTSI